MGGPGTPPFWRTRESVLFIGTQFSILYTAFLINPTLIAFGLFTLLGLFVSPDNV